MNADVEKAVERMLAPLPESWCPGLTARNDARDMALIAQALRDQEAEIAGYHAHAAEIEMMARDAERWRKVRMGRSDWHGDVYAMTFAEDGDYPVCGDQLDALADAMRSAKEDSHA